MFSSYCALITLSTLLVAQEGSDFELVALLRKAASEIGSFRHHFVAQIWLNKVLDKLRLKWFRV